MSAIGLCTRKIVNVLRVQQENMALIRAVIDNPDNKPNGEEESEQKSPLGVQTVGAAEIAPGNSPNRPTIDMLLEAIPSANSEDSGQGAIELEAKQL